ncbi:ABC transporter permease [Tundrisphaera sp. TA3]|uniref:ABC transporter permease n=1 Tax=Tundrisphaera sp. TA3 TaxID=3435775 RepID=UPI003EBB0BA9
MNIEHLRAFVWLRWRILYNTARKAGAVSAALMVVIVVGLVATAIPNLIGTFALGAYLIPKATPDQLMFAWDGLILAFLLFWTIGLLTDLQRSDSLSLSNLLHLPVSVRSAFLINYLSSWTRLSLILFLPVMLGFAFALIFVQGVGQLGVLPLLGGFLLMVTALTYQLQGWLAALMSNPRRRRTVVVMATGVIVLLAQLPNLINIVAPWGDRGDNGRAQALQRELQALGEQYNAKKIEAAEHLRRQTQLIESSKQAQGSARRRSFEAMTRAARLANAILPIGWLPMGVRSAADGQALPVIAGGLGMLLIGSASLGRAYRSTIRAHQGLDASRKTRRASRPSPAATPGRAGSSLLEASFPGLSEPVSAIALGGLRSLLRAPEAKMMLLSPLIMFPILGTVFFRQGAAMPEGVRPFLAVGAMICLLFGFLQLMGNQFGFDRDGFRVFVLSAARRSDILLGKNLSFVPLIAPMLVIVLIVSQVFFPLKWDHLVGMVPQYVSMFLLFCMLANALSILAPFHIAAGTLKGSQPKLSIVLLQVAMFMILFPLTQGLTLIPLGFETLARHQGWIGDAPVFLILALAECVAVILLYWLTLGWFGSMLQSREKLILENVTNRA